MQYWMLVPLLCCVGCTPAVSHQPASLAASTDEAAAELAPVLRHLQRLLDTPAAGDAAIPTEPSADVEVMAVATPEDLAHDGRRFTLYLDREAKLAWITINGGIADHLDDTAGPWPLTHPDVAALRAELAKAEKPAEDGH